MLREKIIIDLKRRFGERLENENLGACLGNTSSITELTAIKLTITPTNIITFQPLRGSFGATYVYLRYFAS